jgi:hypothetical protein
VADLDGVGRVVFFGADDAQVYAIDAETGDALWTFATGDAVYSSPTVQDGVVYVGSHDQNLYALDASTGSKLWHFATGGAVFSSALVQDSALYVGSHDGRVYALDAATIAEEEWYGENYDAFGIFVLIFYCCTCSALVALCAGCACLVRCCCRGKCDCPTCCDCCYSRRPSVTVKGSPALGSDGLPLPVRQPALGGGSLALPGVQQGGVVVVGRAVAADADLEKGQAWEA